MQSIERSHQSIVQSPGQGLLRLRLGQTLMNCILPDFASVSLVRLGNGAHGIEAFFALLCRLHTNAHSSTSFSINGCFFFSLVVRALHYT